MLYRSRKHLFFTSWFDYGFLTGDTVIFNRKRRLKDKGPWLGKSADLGFVFWENCRVRGEQEGEKTGFYLITFGFGAFI